MGAEGGRGGGEGGGRGREGGREGEGGGVGSPSLPNTVQAGLPELKVGGLIGFRVFGLRVLGLGCRGSPQKRTTATKKRRQLRLVAQDM